jgi:hypothetical protein
MLRLHSSDILFNWTIRLNNLVSQTITTSPRVLHTYIGISFGLIVLPPFILFKASLISNFWILHTNCLLRSSEEMSNSMDELSLFLLKSLSKYSRHMFLISSSLVRSHSVTSLICILLGWCPSSSSLNFWSSHRCHSSLSSYPTADIVHHISDLLFHSPSTLRSSLLLCITLRYPHSYPDTYD